MMQIIEKFLVQVVSAVDIAIIRVCNRKERNDRENIILVRLDAIGDFVMWLDSAKEFKKQNRQKVILICNQVCYDIAISTGYFDKVIGIDYGKLRRTSQIRYRWSIHKRLKNIKAAQAIQCTYSKEIFSDMVMSAISAREKITIDSPQIIASRWTYKMALPIYQKVIKTPKDHVMEIRRNAIFTGKILQREVKCDVPELRENKTAQEKVPKEAYYVLFPGASERERMWPIERFAQLAEKLYNEEQYKNLKCCICGSQGEVNLYKLFIQMFKYPNMVINRMGNTSLTELIEIIRGAKFIITNDTSAVHFAAAVNTPAICIWGPWEYGRFLPYDVESVKEKHLPILCWKDMECRNCLLDKLKKTRECENHIVRDGVRKCIDLVTVEDVFSKLISYSSIIL